MSKSPFKSKKFIAMSVAMSFTTLFTAISLLVIATIPAVSSAVVNLMTVVLAAVNGTISVYALGQSAVDWKIQATANTTQHNTYSHIKGLKDMEVKYEDNININWDDVEKIYAYKSES